MKAGWKIALAVLVSMAGLPLAAHAGHGHHRGGGYGGGACGCGAPVQYAPPASAQYGDPTPAVAQGSGGYQSFSYSPTPAGQMNPAPTAAPVMNGQGYYQPAAAYGPSYYGGYSGRRTGRAYENAVNKSLGYNDYGLGRR